METRDAAVLCMYNNPASTSYLFEHHDSVEAVESFLSGCEEIFVSGWALEGTIAHASRPSNEYLAAFATVEAAVQRALTIKSAVRRLALRLGVRAGVRAALAFGPVRFEDHDLFGDTVNLAWHLMRIAGRGRGEGMFLLSDPTGAHTGDGNFLLSERAASMFGEPVRARLGEGPDCEVKRLGTFHSLQFPWDDVSEAVTGTRDAGNTQAKK